MKLKAQMLSIISLTIIVFISILPTVNAAKSQWYPDEKSMIEYKLSNTITLTDGTPALSDKFDFYNSSSYYIAVPSYYKEVEEEIYSGLTLVESEIEIIIKRFYEPESITHLTRESTFIANETEFKERPLFLCFFMDSIKLKYEQVSMVDESVKRNDFDYSLNQPIDYIDNSKGPGSLLGTSCRVLDITEDQILASDVFSLPNGNITYFCDLKGKVNRVSYLWSDSTLKTIGIESSLFIFTLEEKDIPGFSIFTIIGLIFVVSFSIKKRFDIKI